jgi:hypothetical protein
LFLNILNLYRRIYRENFSVGILVSFTIFTAVPQSPTDIPSELPCLLPTDIPSELPLNVTDENIPSVTWWREFYFDALMRLQFRRYWFFSLPIEMAMEL